MGSIRRKGCFFDGDEYDHNLPHDYDYAPLAKASRYC
ncbi:hypothetical protein XM38_038730 [Halomicronema hongdechloris C2206]|uniref:Uncharacterized protein n=1 Tax=Halomicronema hongdechloris C2206 TaxID=1641165 RepID=A0A1Z3HRG8_9CYAN|nr:hypothetical protein XM38_038730 [Halomicronema hongdechloris C2206]